MQSTLKSKRTRSMLMLAVSLLAVPALALAWDTGVAGNAVMVFKDSSVTVASNGSLTSVLQENSSSKGTRMVFAKVILTNASSLQKLAKCRLDVINAQTNSPVCSDWASATLAPGPSVLTEATVSMQCGQTATTSQTSDWFFSRVSCSNTSLGTGVAAAWSKITSIYQSNTTGNAVIVPGT